MSGENPAQIREQADQAATDVTHSTSRVSGLIALTKGQRKAIPKPRTGGEKYVRSMAALATREARFCPHGVDPAQMLRELDSADAYDTLITTLETALQKAKDAQTARRGHAWHDALDVYALVQTLARREPDLHAHVAAFEAFLALGPHDAGTPPAQGGNGGA